MSFGPPRDGRATFQRLDRNPRWAGLPDLNEAGVRAVEAYFRTYGPATPDHLRYWLGNGLGAGRKRIQGGSPPSATRLAAVDIEGDAGYVMADDVDALAATPATTSVRLLPAYDQWVLGPGTADVHVVPPISGSWSPAAPMSRSSAASCPGRGRLREDRVAIDWFAGAPPPGKALEDEVERLATMLGQPLESSIT